MADNESGIAEYHRGLFNDGLRSLGQSREILQIESSIN